MWNSLFIETTNYDTNFSGPQRRGRAMLEEKSTTGERLLDGCWLSSVFQDHAKDTLGCETVDQEGFVFQSRLHSNV